MSKSILVLWLIIVASGYAVAMYLMAGNLQASKLQAETEHRARLDPTADETGRTKVDNGVLEKVQLVNQIPVEAGIYVDRIPKLSMPDTNWRVDFYLWFRWWDENIDPGKDFQVIDGEIVTKELKAKFALDGTRYALYRVVARVSKFFNVSRFPRDDHLLALRIENARHPIGEMVFIPDVPGSAVSSRVEIPGYEIYDSVIVQKPHSYKTTRGDPRLTNDHKATYSQLVYGISIKEPGWALYIKMFLGTFASVAICLLSFLIGSTQTGPRFSVSIGAFCAAVASNYLVSQLIPKSGTVGLTDFVTGTSLVTIFLVVLTSTMSLKLLESSDNARLQRNFDFSSLAVFLIGYVTLNIVIAQAASI
jgi:hypothetical protein